MLSIVHVTPPFAVVTALNITVMLVEAAPPLPITTTAAVLAGSPTPPTASLNVRVMDGGKLVWLAPFDGHTPITVGGEGGATTVNMNDAPDTASSKPVLTDCHFAAFSVTVYVAPFARP
jgi:hypothetical protein